MYTWQDGLWDGWDFFGSLMMDGHSFGVVYDVFQLGALNWQYMNISTMIMGIWAERCDAILGSSADAIRDTLYRDEVVASEIWSSVLELLMWEPRPFEPWENCISCAIFHTRRFAAKFPGSIRLSYFKFYSCQRICLPILPYFLLVLHHKNLSLAHGVFQVFRRGH